MPEKPGPFQGIEDLSNLEGEQRSLGSLGDDERVLADTFDGIEPGGPPPVPDSVEHSEIQPATQATMECMRGPCQHHWRMVMRMDAQSEVMTIQRVQYCSFHVELMNLADSNAYECDQWWPALLMWVPDSIRPMLRPAMRDIWDRWLKARGESFAWRWWPRNVWSLSPDEVFELREEAMHALRAARKGDNGHGG